MASADPLADTFNPVDVSGLVQLVMDYGRQDRPRSDINGDGVADMQDIGYVARHPFARGDPE